MWWLWGPSNGYAIFLIAPPFTLWVVWHGIFSVLRRKTKDQKWWLNMYIVEIPFRILCSINLLLFSRWVIVYNPPPWNWAADSINAAPMHFSVFVAFKQACVAFILLLVADVLLNIKYVRTFFKLEPVVDQKRTGYIVSIFLLIGCLFWLLDSIFHTLAFDSGRSFIDFLALDIPASNLFTRIFFLLFCMASGMVTARILRKQKQSDERIRLSEEKFRTFFMLGRVGMAITSPEKGWLQVNEQMCDLLGYSVDELTKLTWDELTHPDDMAADIKQFNRVLVNEIDTYSIEKRIIRKDGSIIPTTLWLSCVRNSDKSVKYLIVHLADNTLRKQAENEKTKLVAQLHQSQKLESIGTLAGGIAHDFNNILSAVIGYTELALDSVEKATPLERDLQEVYTAGLRAKDLVSQILTFARQSDEELKPIQIDFVIKEVLKFIRSSIPTTIEIKQNINSDSLIMGNATQVHRIMMNLCTNAAHAMEKRGGELEVTLKDTIVDRTTKRANPHLKLGHYIEIKVSDTGDGIDPKNIDKIFEPYFTTKGTGEGTGLGLAMVHGIIETYSGKIFVESELAKGTIFTIYLPIAKRENTPLPCKSTELPTGQERILFVDDEIQIAKIASRILGDLGYTVTIRTNSTEALELFRSKQSDFDLVITDMTMPTMNGDQLSKKLIEIKPDLPIILCTGYSKNLSEKEAFNIGVKALTYKPIVKEDLAVIIRKVLDGAKD